MRNITIQDVHAAAEQNAEKYIDRAKAIAKNAFIEGAVWANKQNTTNHDPETLDL